MTTHKITIELDADVLEHTVAGKTYQTKIADIHNDGFAYALAYGWQRAHNDRTGGSDKTPEDKHEIQASVTARMCDGTIAHRATRTGEPAINRHIRGIIRKAAKTAYKAFCETESDARARDQWCMNKFAKQSEDTQAKITVKAQAALDKAIAQAKENAALESELDIEV